MFGLGIFTYLKIGLVIVVLAVCGYYVWSYQHMKGQITELKAEIDGLKLRAEIIEKAQKATDEYLKKKTIIQTRVVKEKANVDKVVESNDNPAMRDLFIRNGLLQDNRNDPKGGATSRP
jgi:hypothetical protein